MAFILEVVNYNLFLCKDTPVWKRLLGETYNPIQGHGPYTLILNERTAEGPKAGIELDGRYVFGSY